MRISRNFQENAWKWMLVTTILSCCLTESYGSLARGWGDHIKWRTYLDGLEEAKKSGKPIMLVIHKTWCGACKALKPKFAESTEISALSNMFVMVNTEDEEEPRNKEFVPDGGYIPRIFFLDAFGNVQKDFYNEFGNQKFKYFYGDAESIARSMKKAAAKMEGGLRVGDEL
ncbi:predicted protein [Nematostella vectensis]|uniref:Thioredoxin domain-containing protein 12 n=1 Tax=Nematostella vectensis TaxID=45351 RepID=A7RX19_NEMVE|nr:thioredoxin domain-containing protein 12 [Nematostella vectensis]XP_032241625.1 thioredoxin domain-containing protein 12 [Nematostella vectensis]EDO43891.1 predicted protein [Nematostella vectensis]|eukprot:XP_001635954.1 predicted protein [Nematostella vectensis]